MSGPQFIALKNYTSFFSLFLGPKLAAKLRLFFHSLSAHQYLGCQPNPLYKKQNRQSTSSLFKMRSSTEAEAGAASSIFSTPRWPSSRRTHSLSSSSLSSASSDSLPPSPATPLRRYTAGGGRIPFSWESIPGIPKNNQITAKVPPSIDFPHDHSYLPLPPAAKSNQKSIYENVTRRGREGDPFFAALVECSKGGGNGGDDDGHKDVFGSIWKGVMPKPIGRSLFMSCKSASDIAESLVLIPRGGGGRRTRRTGYEMVKK